MIKLDKFELEPHTSLENECTSVFNIKNKVTKQLVWTIEFEDYDNCKWTSLKIHSLLIEYYTPENIEASMQALKELVQNLPNWTNVRIRHIFKGNKIFWMKLMRKLNQEELIKHLKYLRKQLKDKEDSNLEFDAITFTKEKNKDGSF